MDTTTTKSIRIANPTYLRIIRATWLVLGIIGLISFLAGVPFNYDYRLGRSVLLFTEPLNSIGLSPQTYSLYLVLVEVVYVLVSVVVAFILFTKRSNDMAALIVSLALITFSTTIGPTSRVFATSVTLFLWPVIIVDTVGKVSLIGLTFIFPDGRFIPRWARWLVPIYAVLMFLFAVDEHIWHPGGSQLMFIALMGFLALGLITQRWRYVHTATLSQKQQTKWAVYGMAVAIIPALFWVIIDILITPWLADHAFVRMFYLLGSWIFFIGLPISVFPISVMMAMLRSRLWDIDLVINRTIVGFLVAGLLIVLSVAGVLILQAILGETYLAVAFLVTTVAAILLINPLRRRIRHFVDVRIYGFRVDLNDLKKADQKPEVKNPGMLTGRTLSKYEVLGVVATGGMGEVYKGFHDGDVVAIKVVLPEKQLDKDILVRFDREANITSLLEHPNIVKLYEAGIENETRYMVLEFIDGQDLGQFVKARGQLDKEEVLEIFEQLCNALDYTHTHNIVHRDIKPSNIMLRLADDNETQHVILMDYGIAKIISNGSITNPSMPAASLNGTTDTELVGTADYMAPEQLIASKNIDHRADVYAMGVTLYEMLTGQRPFSGGVGQVVFALLQQPPPDPRKFVPEMPSRLAELLLRALAKDPDDRFQSAGEFFNALKEAQ